ncbi:MAG TPA: beta-L-arabinofuranosidase domain-containing protein [Acidobacteriaceae bacterium]|nr:beta-L-arabinofuranosidase domain-containing protein [Acidobacteriaceae bacterium]
MSTRRDFVKMVAGASLAPSVLRASKAFGATPTETGGLAARVYLEPFDYQGVRLLDSMLKSQYDRTREYYFKIPNDDILKGFRERAGLPAPGQEMGGWAQDDTSGVFGQWLSGMARMYKATGDTEMREKAAALMNGWAEAYRKDGIPISSRHRALNGSRTHYSYDKTVCGLVDMGKYAGNKDALALLDRLVDWGSTTLTRTRNPATPEDDAAFGSGNEWYTLSENLYRGYVLTGNSKYKTFGDLWRYDTYWDKFVDEANPDIHDLHAYSHVNTLSSAAMSYGVTGDEKYLKTIVNAHDYFQRAQCYATGGYGPGESLVSNDGSLGRSLESVSDTFETPCGSWSIFKLTKYLLQFTGEARFGDWMERAVYNGIGAALPMALRGRTFYYSDYLLGGCQKTYYSAAWPCCSGTYIQDTVDYHDIIYFKGDRSLYVNLFVPSQVAWSVDDKAVQVEQVTDFPASDTTTLTVRPERPVKFSLKFRVPGWTEGAWVSVNGDQQHIECRPGTWAAVNRTWNAGDRMEIHLPMKLAFAPIDRQHPHRVAAIYGPVVLVRDKETVLVPNTNDISKWIVSQGKGLEFHAENHATAGFVPFYQLRARTGYCMYFDLESA